MPARPVERRVGRLVFRGHSRAYDVAVRYGLGADLCDLGANLVNHFDARVLTDVPLFGHSMATSISQLVIPLKFI